MSQTITDILFEGGMIARGAVATEEAMPAMYAE